MKQAIKCALRLHTYEIYKELDIVDVRDNVIGKLIVNRCKHCGKISTKRMNLVDIC